MSREEAVAFGLEHHSSVKNMELGVRYREWQTDMEHSSYLPEIRSSADYRNNLQLPVTILPGDAFGDPEGRPLEIQMGTRHAVRAGVDIRQPVFDPLKLARMDRSEVREELASNQLSGAKKRVALEISRAYFQALLRKELLELSSSQVVIHHRMEEIVSSGYRNALISQEQMDDTRQRLESAEREKRVRRMQYTNSLRELKLAMEYPAEKALTVADTSMLQALSESDPVSGKPDITELPEYREIELQLDLNNTGLKMLRGRYLPVLDLYGFLGTQYFDEDFRPIENDQRWFHHSYVGASLSLPIFEGLGRHREKQSLLVSREQLMLQKERLGKEIRRQEEILRNRMEIARLESRIAGEEYRWKREQFNLRLDSYEAGLTDYRSVLQADLEMLLEKQQFETALYDALRSRLDYEQLVSVY